MECHVMSFYVCLCHCVGISEDSRSVDMATRDLGDKGFYTETFHCASWIYSGDEVSPTAGPVPPGLQPRTVTSRTPFYISYITVLGPSPIKSLNSEIKNQLTN